MSILARALASVLLLVLAVPSSAQQTATNAPGTREEAIASERADKVAELWPERQSPMVDTANRLVGARAQGRPRLREGRQWSADRAWAACDRARGSRAGIGYRRSDLWANASGYRATARGTLQGAYLFDFNLDFQGLETERTAVKWYTKVESSPDIDFYGLGNATPKENHTSYSLRRLRRPTSTPPTRRSRQPAPRVHGGFSARRFRSRQRRLPSDRRALPAGRDSRVRPGHASSRASAPSWTSIIAIRRQARAAAACTACAYREYWDVDQKTFAFRQTEYEFQQYFPYFNKGRVIAVRAGCRVVVPQG